ncbi:unnamed protein product [Adineta ricciae]|uniref:Reverse transcriptase domain-containing protein n=1 Tax=Adineta ricciae TaxID=249248 RepID=A0A816EA25_ADIRI|nr:unnamed protein product [Adineta ricciae]CAF1644011.1 unnamed protein product [Adineta ricciae]
MTATSEKEKADLFADYFENEVYSLTADTLPFHDQVTSQANKVKNGNITLTNTVKWKLIKKQGYIPAMWEKANIILLLKPKKDKQHPSSYRPISLLSCLGKLLEKIIKQRLMLELERHNILPQHQAGFRPGKSTIYNISDTPQRSPLSPLLYIMYTADSMNGIPTHTEHGLFADDTALWTSGNILTSLRSRLQESINAFESWCKS